MTIEREKKKSTTYTHKHNTTYDNKRVWWMLGRFCEKKGQKVPLSVFFAFSLSHALLWIGKKKRKAWRKDVKQLIHKLAPFLLAVMTTKPPKKVYFMYTHACMSLCVQQFSSALTPLLLYTLGVRDALAKISGSTSESQFYFSVLFFFSGL